MNPAARWRKNSEAPVNRLILTQVNGIPDAVDHYQQAILIIAEGVFVPANDTFIRLR
jgi:hypothetical protein